MRVRRNKLARLNKSFTKKLKLLKVKDKSKLALSITSLIILLISLSQLERLINHGTLFGYSVHSAKSSSSTSRKKASGSTLDAKVSKTNEKSIACETFPEDKVKKLLNTDLKRASGFMKDKTEPSLVSRCIYISDSEDNKDLSVSMLIRDMKDESTAKKTVQSLISSEKGEEIKDLGDAGYFNVSTNQLSVAKSKRVITITVSGLDNPRSISEDIVKLAL